MTITINEYGSVNYGNQVNDPVINPNILTDKLWVFTDNISSSQVSVTQSYKGFSFRLLMEGSFDTKGVSAGMSIADMNKNGGPAAGQLLKVTLTIDGAVAGTQSFSSPVSFPLWATASTSSISAQALYKGPLVFISGNGTSSVDSFYGYSGYATYYANHVYSDKRDIFVGGTGGINKLVVPGTQSSYAITPNSAVFDTNSQKAALDGYTVSDKTRTYGSVDISAVQRIEFRDGNLALDVDGNAGKVAKILGAIFGPASVRDKVYAGIGLYFLDAGMSVENLTNLALNARLGSSYTAEQEIQLLYQNLFGHSASANEVSAVNGLLTSGTHTNVSLAMLAIETSNNIANINLVGLAQTGLAYTPYAG